jgi:outer membrane protein TolC
MMFPRIGVLGLTLCHLALAQTPPAPLTLTLDDALARARTNSPQIIAANIAALLAREDTLQAKAALLPNANGFSQFIYTQPNGLPSGIFVANDGVHVYVNQVIVHGDIYAPAKLADYHKSQLAEAVAKAKAEIAARGLVAVVVEDYYTMVSAGRKLANGRQSLAEVQQFLDITQKQERGGEVAHSDTVLAQVLQLQRQRDLQEAQLALDKARLAFAVLLFPDFRQDFALVDDLDSARELPAFDQIQGMASRNSPDIRAAEATVQQQTFELKSVRAERLPSLSFDYYYGMYANQFALNDREGRGNLGSQAQAQLNIPLWTWGAAKSKVRQAELQLRQARSDLSLTQRQLLANLHSYYLESEAAGGQVASLRQSMELSALSLRLTMLRYQGGESSVLEVKDAQTTLTEARNALDDGLVRYRLALANLQTLTGAF